MLAGHAMTFPVTPPQFFNLTKNLCNVPGVQVRMSNLLSGSISNSDVTLSYAYDGMAVLTVDVTAKHSFKAKLASDSEIQQKIQALLTANSRGF